MVRTKAKAVEGSTPRPWHISYAGLWDGHACSAEGAIIAACKHMVRDGCTRATITHKETGKTAWVQRTGPHTFSVRWADLPKPRKPNLRRVK